MKLDNLKLSLGQMLSAADDVTDDLFKLHNSILSNPGGEGVLVQTPWLLLPLTPNNGHQDPVELVQCAST